MGRPLNKRYFGEPTVGGNEIKVRFFATGQLEADGWIVKQKGSKRFVCTDGTNTDTCVLADKSSGALVAGEMTITVKLDNASVAQVVKISGRKVTLDNGTSIPWNFSDANDDGAVEMEEAGDDDSFTNADDFEL